MSKPFDKVSIEERVSFTGQPCCLPFSHPNYEPPTPDQVSYLVKACGWSQREVALIAGVGHDPKKGSTTVRKWRAPADKPEHRQIPYAAWRLLLIYAGVVVAGSALESLQRP